LGNGDWGGEKRLGLGAGAGCGWLVLFTGGMGQLGC
jgi:hypothetical protein